MYQQLSSSDDEDLQFNYNLNSLQTILLQPPPPPEDEDQPLPPKLQPQPSNIISNPSTHTNNKLTSNRKSINAVYTVKLKKSKNKRKNDPVALFQQTCRSWQKDKFLTSRADNKEGRKLNLQKRNKRVEV